MNKEGLLVFVCDVLRRVPGPQFERIGELSRIIAPEGLTVDLVH